MTNNRKYAALPDLDSAPDIYETPDLTDDASTLPTTAARSASPGSNRDFDDSANPSISKQSLRPQQARSQFSPARVDAREVDFSDRVDTKRKSYNVSSRRARKGDHDAEELGDFSDDEDESLERKLARLRREVEEVRDEMGKRQAEKDGEMKAADKSEDDNVIDEEGVAELSNILDGLHTSQHGSTGRAERELAHKLSTSLIGTDRQVLAPASEGTAGSNSAPPPPSYSITYAPNHTQTHALAKAADFDTRLAQLEKLLGLPSPLSQTPTPPRPILPTLTALQSQISTIAEATPASLDAIARRVRHLTQETERFEEARRTTKAASAATNADDHSSTQPTADQTNNDEQTAKISALYGTLPTIESLAPLLPSVLDRLRSLRDVHAGAAEAGEALDRAEKRQEEMEREIARWREGLEKVEGAVKGGEEVLRGNVKVVEGWVRELEGRVETVEKDG
ncbi:MAG: hypothetical protein M1833_002535 [Piccolia ochrophora]|nr:MAG: hypothetical protein M1833_002535 [Piccolia ochrophora]